MTSAKIECPNCHRKYNVAEKILGKKVTCANEACGAKFMAELADSDERRDIESSEGPSDGAESVESPPPLPSNFTADSPKPKRTSDDGTLAAETRLHHKRMTILATFAAIPGVLVLVGLCFGAYYYANAYMEKRAIEGKFRDHASIFIDTARRVVAAWPDDAETFVETFNELSNHFQSFPKVRDNPKIKDEIEMFRAITLGLISPSSFIQSRKRREDHLEELSKSDSGQLREFGKQTRQEFEEERRRMDEDVRMASELIEIIHKNQPSK